MTSKWNPMSLAPKNKEILLTDGHRANVGYWLKVAGFVHGWVWSNSEFVDYCQPIGWMDLPSPIIHD